MLLPVRVPTCPWVQMLTVLRSTARVESKSRQRQLFRFTSMRQLFPFVLCFRLLNRLPLHV